MHRDSRPQSVPLQVWWLRSFDPLLRECFSHQSSSENHMLLAARPFHSTIHACHYAASAAQPNFTPEIFRARLSERATPFPRQPCTSLRILTSPSLSARSICPCAVALYHRQQPITSDRPDFPQSSSQRRTTLAAECLSTLRDRPSYSGILRRVAILPNAKDCRRVSGKTPLPLVWAITKRRGSLSSLIRRTLSRKPSSGILAPLATSVRFCLTATPVPWTGHAWT